MTSSLQDALLKWSSVAASAPVLDKLRLSKVQGATLLPVMRDTPLREISRAVGPETRLLIAVLADGSTDVEFFDLLLAFAHNHPEVPEMKDSHTTIGMLINGVDNLTLQRV